MAEPLHALSARELGRAFASGDVSPVEATRAALARIEAWEPAINALYLVRHEEALAEAGASEARWRRGEAYGALDGVPITLKDNVAMAGAPGPLGTAALDTGQPAALDAPPTARVREAGCVVLGKTTMPDFGMLSSGLSSVHGVTRNPWDTALNTWGSSSGAGAGLVAGYGPLALGTDIGGSVRLPAAACGVFALKPSLGRVPIDPPYFGRVTGPMTRTVADAALLMTVLTKADARDWMNLPPTDTDWAADAERELKGVRFGLMLEAGSGLPTEPAVREAVTAAAELLARHGAIIEPVEPFGDEAMAAGINRFFQARLATELLKLPPERQAKVLPFIREWCLEALGWSAVELFRAFNEIPRMREAAVKATEPFDYLLSPTTPIDGYPAEHACPGNDPRRPFEHICFTAPFNQSEQPAASIPCGFTPAGRPVGLQIVGKRFDDLGVLQIAAAYERLRPAMPAWPEPPA